jgi:hypothetical protein
MYIAAHVTNNNNYYYYNQLSRGAFRVAGHGGGQRGTVKGRVVAVRLVKDLEGGRGW